MIRVNQSLVRLIFFMAVVSVSLLSGALLHVYASSSTGQGVASAASNDNSSDLTHESRNAHVKAVALSKKTVDVCPGDTLWNIASAHLPKGENIRAYIHKIKKENGLLNSELKPGQILILP